MSSPNADAPWRSSCRPIARAARAFRTSQRSAGRCRCSTLHSPRPLPRTARIGSRRRVPARLLEQRAAYRAGLPGPLYCDTSALIKLYLPEPGSDEFNEVVEGRDDVLVSDLAVTEFISALARRLRQGSLAREAARRLQHAILGRLDEEVYHRVELTRDVHRRAEQFLLSLPETPLRAADALHLALATSARAASLASFDARLAAAARAGGLAIYPA
ncbi:MAG: hypothetical protein DME10_12825 [Candidatus Rokuibacteriota bacterium]|nr:MAG: hypothetical protein DME10_12825 [Candidatus Rokubacteria bacterium]